MSIGISTACLYPDVTEVSLKRLINIGFKTFEVFLNSPMELDDEFIYEIKGLLNTNGCKVKSIHPFSSGMEPFMIFSSYYRRFKDSLKYYEKYYKAALKLGAEILVLHGGKKKPSGGISDEEYFERFYKLSELGEKYNVVLAHENVNAFVCQNPDFIIKMNNALKEKAKYVFDIKQSIRAGHDPIEVCKAMGKNIVHIHINDNKLGDDCLLPGFGSMKYHAIKEILDRNNYHGDFIIEVYRNSFNELDELVRSREFLSKEFNNK